MHDSTLFRDIVLRWRTGITAAVLMTGLGFAAGSTAQERDPEVVEVDGSLWSLVTGDGASSWQESEAFCATLEAGGYDDWRLPVLAELETLYDPAAAGGIRAPFEIPDCCAWSSENLADLEADPKGELPVPGGPPALYYWGYLFDGGIRYYSNGRFADGFALCTRDL